MAETDAWRSRAAFLHGVGVHYSGPRQLLVLPQRCFELPCSGGSRNRIPGRKGETLPFSSRSR